MSDPNVELISSAFSEAFRKRRPGPDLRTGTVVGMNTIDGTVVVFIDGDDEPIEVPALASTYAEGRVAVLFSAGGAAAMLGTYGSVWRPYDVDWVAQGLAPGIGNGRLDGWYLRDGANCHVIIDLTAGSTTSGGSEQMSFSLPFPPRTDGDTLEVAHLLAATQPAWRFGGQGGVHTDTSSLYGYVTPYMTTSTTDARLRPMQNRDATNLVGTGIPVIAGSDPLTDGSFLRVKGWYRCE